MSILANIGSEILVIRKNVKENVRITLNVTCLYYMNEEDGKAAGSKQTTMETQLCQHKKQLLGQNIAQ